MSDYTDIHELMLIVDVAISDYSSVALDFSNSRRPVFLYASDVDEYQRMRGLKEMYFKYPFPLFAVILPRGPFAKVNET